VKKIKFLQICRRISQSENSLDDLLAVIKSTLLFSSKLYFSRKVLRKNQGKLIVNGKFFFGTFTNRVGLNPNNNGVLRIYKSGVLKSIGIVRIARDCKIYVAGYLEIGNGTYINPNSLIFCRTKITIGDNCAISWNCEIIDDDMHTLIIDKNTGVSSKEIRIGNRVWVGSNVRILKGVNIGNNSVIASGSVVTHDVPENTLVAGIPAKILKDKIDWR
jgi:acetyltransferase-like isoleucine patch superfamily enzyme